MTPKPSWYHARSVLAAFVPFRRQFHAPLRAWALFLALPACGAAQPGTPIGMSDAAPETAPPPPQTEQPRVAWPDFDAARAWPEAAPPAVALAHRRDGSFVHVRVEPAALPAYLELAVDSPMPEGARLVAWHESPAGQLLDGYLLEKRAGTWSATVIDAHGSLVPGSRDACLRCHDMAPTDHLFGRRSPATSALPAARDPSPSTP